MRSAPSPQMLPSIQEEQQGYASSPDDTVNATTKKRPSRVAFDPSGMVMQRGDVLDRVFEKVEATICDHRESGAQMDPPALLKQSFSIVESDDRDEPDDEQHREERVNQRRQGGTIEEGQVSGKGSKNSSTMEKEDDAISCISFVQHANGGPPPPRDPTPRMRRTDMTGQVYSSSKSVQGQKKDILDFVFESVEGYICREQQRHGDPVETGRVKVNENGGANSDSSSPIKLHELATSEPTNETSNRGNFCLTNPFQCRVEYKDAGSGKDSATKTEEDKVGDLPKRDAPQKSVMGSLLDVFSMSEDDDVSHTQSVKLEILKTRKRELESQRRAILALDKPEVDLESNTVLQTIETEVQQSTRPRSRVLLVVAGVSTFVASGILVFFLILWLV
eukprot:Nitzschia sp. Nitz4//scaffold63_size106090//70958//72130//NITZ4_004400-RA/size106090-processed-gene-0.87-mRNA-1//-1//CDS//3329556005//468//frame0